MLTRMPWFLEELYLKVKGLFAGLPVSSPEKDGVVSCEMVKKPDLLVGNPS